MAATKPRELAEAIMAWSEARIDPVTIALRLAPIDKTVRREANRIVREKLIPAAAERDVDEYFAQHGRYKTQEELDEGWAKLAAQSAPKLIAADAQRLI